MAFTFSVNALEKETEKTINYQKKKTTFLCNGKK